jgi:predicted nucleic acid-binding Zn ribbon protein
MSPDRDLEHFSESLDDVFARLGLPDPVVMAALSSEWDELAGPPWSGRSTPLYIRGKTLVVEAMSASMVAFLRYGETALLEKLAERFGLHTVDTIDITAPGRR